MRFLQWNAKNAVSLQRENKKFNYGIPQSH